MIKNFCLLNDATFLHKKVSDFQSALKGSSTFTNSYGFKVDHTH